MLHHDSHSLLRNGLLLAFSALNSGTDVGWTVVGREGVGPSVINGNCPPVQVSCPVQALSLQCDFKTDGVQQREMSLDTAPDNLH